MFNVNREGQVIRWLVVALVAAVTAVTACIPSTIQVTAGRPDVQQQTTPTARPPADTQRVGQYPAFSEYTGYTKQSTIYAQWYKDVERCTGKRGRGAEGMRWLVAMTPLFNIDGGPLLRGAYWRDGRTAMVGLGGEFDSLLVRHEMVHDILGLPDSTADNPIVSHPPNIFPARGDTTSRAACAGVIH